MCRKTHFRIDPMVLPTRNRTLKLQADSELSQDCTKKPQCINAPECYTHMSAAVQTYPSYYGYGYIRPEARNNIFATSLNPSVSLRAVLFRLHVLHSDESAYRPEKFARKLGAVVLLEILEYSGWCFGERSVIKFTDRFPFLDCGSEPSKSTAMRSRNPDARNRCRCCSCFCVSKLRADVVPLLPLN